MRERYVAALVFGFLIAIAPPAARVHAQSASPDVAIGSAQKREASAHFQRGAALFTEGDYPGALAALTRAYEIAPNYRVLYNIGQTHVALGEYAEAIRAFEAYLAQGGSGIEASRRAEVETQRTELHKSTAELAIAVNRAGARVAVDGAEVGTSPLPERVVVNPGKHRIAVQDGDGARARAKVEVAAGDLREVSLTLTAPTVAAAEPAHEEVASRPAHRLSRRKKWGLGVLAGAGALGLSGMAVALVARSARDDHAREVRALPGDPLAIARAHNKLAATAIGADVLFGAAVAAVVTGAVLLLVRDPESDRRIQVGLTPTGVLATGRF